MRVTRALGIIFITCVVAAGLIVAVAGLWFRNAVYGDRSLPTQPAHLIVPRGATFSQIAAQLKADGVVRQVVAFRILARLRHAEADVRAGEYRFQAHQNESDILEQLRSGGAQIAVWVSIPEGFTAQQIAQRLQEAGVGDARSFADTFRRDSITLGGVRTKSLEGYLFPSTYLVPTGASPQAVASLFTTQFRAELPRDAVAFSRARHMSIPQIVTLASLIEREAKADDERALMAGVYYNRLRLGMPLEVDATIEYTFPEHKTEITYADLAVDSPYNTYKHAGLPPTPIANPGRPSLWAAFHPQSSQYLYYVYKGNGHHAFARTLAEHNANKARYLK
ncbi:MAG: endolytic transglycosylase MltG [Candidatus Eremiobacteraeota bacterium]|nr:endolytic transglycosylase MltG [Candidatus Eremiobacteraeota bacterium]